MTDTSRTFSIIQHNLPVGEIWKSSFYVNLSRKFNTNKGYTIPNIQRQLELWNKIKRSKSKESTHQLMWKLENPLKIRGKPQNPEQTHSARIGFTSFFFLSQAKHEAK